MTRSAAVGKHSTQVPLIRYSRAVPRSSAKTNPTAASCFRWRTRGLPDGDGRDDLPDGHRLAAAGQQRDDLRPGPVGQSLEPGRVGVGVSAVGRFCVLHR